MTKSKDKPHWPGWFYGPNGAAEIFQCREDVPAGWEDHPSKVIAPELSGDSLKDHIAKIADIVESIPKMEITKAPAKPVKAKRPYRRRKVA